MNVLGRPALPRFSTVEAFLDWEDQQDGKHEFHEGRVIPMTGGTKAHQRMVLNLRLSLGRLIDPAQFEVIREMRIRVPGLSVRYPDIVVVPGTVDWETATLTDALAIFEVLSPGTARADRGEKFEVYRRLPALRSYILLEPKRRAVAVRRLQPDGAWSLDPEATDILRLPEINVELPLAEIYAGMPLGS